MNPSAYCHLTRHLAWRLFFILLLACGPSLTVRAQSRAVVSGVLVDAAGASVAFATVTLHRAADSTVVKSEFSDEKGAYRLEAAVGGRYRVSAAQVGLARYWSAPFELSAGGAQLLSATLVANAATNLQEVTVVGQKALFERLADRTVVNVEGSTLAAGASSLDVLQRSPGVTVDGNDNLGLRGKQGVLVILDGKRVPMTGTELANLLRGLPADQVKNIELITNPPAKYDAQGTAGVIVINLRKDQRQGTNLSTNLSYGRSDLSTGRFTGGMSLNHRYRQLNAFGSYSYSDRQNRTILTINRDFLQDSRVVGQSLQENRVNPHWQSHTWKAGLDYNLSEQTVLGVAFNGQQAQLRQNGSNQTTIYDDAGAAQGHYRSTLDQHNKAPNLAANLNLKHTLRADSSGGRQLTADADYARYTTDRLQNLLTHYSARPDTLLRGDQDGLLTIRSVKADYTHPLPHQLLLEAGAKTSYVTADNHVVFTKEAEGITRLDPNQTNHFRYTENVNAGYLSLTQALPRWNLQAGLRLEQTTMTGRQEVGDARFDRHYYQFFPSLGVKRTLSDKHDVSLSLSRRIDRPNYQQLNPFRSWIDATTYGSGNQNLVPQTSYNAELSYTFRQKYTTTLGYIRTDKPIIDVVQPESSTSRYVVARNVNLTTQNFYSVTLTLPVEVTKWWTVYNTLTGYYNHFEGSVAGSGLNAGRAAFNLNTAHTFTLGKGWSADLNGSYQSNEVYGFFRVKPFGDVTAGVQKTVAKGRGTIKANVSDLFYTNPIRATSSYRNYTERFYQGRDSRVVTLSVSYRVGNEKLAPSRRRQSGAEDEKRRAG